MSHTAVKTAIEDALSTPLGAVPVVAMDNVVPDVPVDADGFPTTFAATFYVGSSQPLDIGSPDTRQWRENGSATVVVFSPSGAGSSDTLTQAIRDHFEQNPGMGGLTIHTVSEGAAFPPMAENRSLGNYWARSVVLGYQYDY